VYHALVRSLSSKKSLLIWAVLLSILLATHSQAAAKKVIGTPCKKAGISQTVAGKSYKCVLVKKKLIWQLKVVSSNPSTSTNESSKDQLDALESALQIAIQAKAAAELKAKQEAEAKAAAELKAKQEAEAKLAAELKAKQEAEAKAAAELKAKQEAEAKAAAELKAKQEAEAKAAAELKAKQEAEAKAAAELKAKQEADAKAAAELKAKQEAEAKAAADAAALANAKNEAERLAAQAAIEKSAAEAKAKQEADAKAAAELKAKQEADAKAAAELKAKQEADAKAATELKAKQEADAKAATELKAKQEAELPKIAGLSIGELMWGDDFKGSKGSAIDSSNWTLRNCHLVPEFGGGACFNDERQLYSKTAVALDGTDSGSALISTERLLGTSFTQNGVCRTVFCPFVSGRFDTHGKVSFQYGYIEARIQMPSGSGNHPAFWMLGDNINQVGWPTTGEMDIVEIHSNRPTVSTAAVNFSTSYSPNFCCGNHNFIVKELDLGSNVSSGFHLYSLAWLQDKVSFYVDGKHVLTVTPKTLGGYWSFNAPYFLIFNNAISENFSGSWANLQSSQMKIDWVRAYKLEGQGTVIKK
jgi:beta-glucanase (GH16 family)